MSLSPSGPTRSLGYRSASKSAASKRHEADPPIMGLFERYVPRRSRRNLEKSRPTRPRREERVATIPFSDIRQLPQTPVRRPF